MVSPVVHPDAVWAVLLSEAALSVMCGALSVRTRHSRDALLRVEAALTLVTALALVLCHRVTVPSSPAVSGHPLLTRSAVQGVQRSVAPRLAGALLDHLLRTPGPQLEAGGC